MADDTPFDRACAAMLETPPDDEAAFAHLTEAHEAGDARASYALGTWYLHGHFVKRNLRTAMAFLRQAAKQGHPDALYDLAICHEKGAGTRKSEAKAAECYLAALLEGDEQSIYELGRCFYWGIGVQQNRRLARVLMDKADRLGLD